MSRLQAALNSFGDGDVEEKRALESALLKAQKQSPTAKFNPAADLLRKRVAERCAGVSEPIPADPQDLQFWVPDKYLELRDASLGIRNRSSC